MSYEEVGEVGGKNVQLGQGGVGDFGSGVGASGTPVPKTKKTKKQMDDELDEEQAKELNAKIDNFMSGILTPRLEELKGVVM